ncbi:non-ribosomal peptide synthetase [Paenibacillus sp. MZ03-122A]|uniref:non-ribosomal peptide synthetase n=1 Tax=Paenibacillus sp. MZ03-122A TaxID=2962033 RepID=UPI0020B651D6|nr:non-ribosomal peptide synthetase [Paenibacillus sp. MZ03-122A]MCP3781444.1 amino acid adenylation domain-containing protein [Paenibacillus sp. MZ03-122A]
MEKSYDNIDQLKRYYTLTHAQKRVWNTERIFPEQPLHNIGGSILISGQVQFDLLEKAIHAFIARNDALCLSFIETEGEVRQYKKEYRFEPLPLIDFTAFSNPQEQYELWVMQQKQRFFKLEHEHLFRFFLVKLNELKMGYFVIFHHLIADGWSIQIMTEQIREAYEQLLLDGSIQLIESPSYLDYLYSEKMYLESDRFVKNKSYWLDLFGETTDREHTCNLESFAAARKTFGLDRDLSIRIKDFLNQKNWTINTFFIAVMALYLYKTTQRKRIVLGNPTLNRSGKTERRMFGMFTSTMPILINFDEVYTASQLMDLVHYQVKKGLLHQKFPYNLLLKELSSNQNPIDGLFQIVVNYYNTKLPTEFAGMKVENIEFNCGSQTYPLQMVVKEWGDTQQIQLDFDYRLDVYDEAFIDRIFGGLCLIVKQLLISTDVQLFDIRIMEDLEIHRAIFEFNNSQTSYPNNQSITELFELQVNRIPEKPAIICSDRVISYRELNEKANQLARSLRSTGMTERQSVVIIINHSEYAVIAILAVLKAGGAYIPIDPVYPEERIADILQDSSAKWLITDDPARFIGRLDCEILDTNDEANYLQENYNLNIPVQPDELAYMIYTSGSTGKPKGVMVEHKGLVNYIWWAGKAYIRDEHEAFALYSSLAFDLTVTSLFTPLVHGNKMIIFRDSGRDNLFYEILSDTRVTILKMTPSHFALIKELEPSLLQASKISTFILGGEDLKVGICKEMIGLFGQSISIYNEYGPTETVVGCMIYQFDPKQDTTGSVPIGLPIDNMKIYILDEYLQPLPVGTVGELYIAGDGVAGGYWKREEMTKERFLSNPFITGGRMYKSGDLARRREHGIIEYLGRVDHQVKVRGYRIELGEIENMILRIQGISEAVVVIGRDESEASVIYAYVTIRESRYLLDEQEIRVELAKRLPAYMVPQRIIIMSKLPLTHNGKVDRKALPILVHHAPTILGSPSNEKEIELIKIISEIMEKEDIGTLDNFYHLGGDSIVAIQIATRLKKKGLLIKVKHILEFPVIKEMAATIEYLKINEEIHIPQGIYEGDIPLSPTMKWFLFHYSTEPHYYHQSCLITLKRNIPIEILQMAIQKLLIHHDGLRINYDLSRNSMFYNNQIIDKNLPIKLVDLSSCNPLSNEKIIYKHSCELKSSIKITEDIPIRVCMFNGGMQTDSKLLLIAHHMLVDAVSWRILLEDLDQLITSIEENLEISLPQKTTSVKEFVKVLQTIVQEKEIILEEDYWRPLLHLPGWTSKCTTSMNADLIINHDYLNMERFEQANFIYGTDAMDLILAAFGVTVCNWLNSEKAVIEIEGHGREAWPNGIDLTRSVGWFTVMFPFEVHSINAFESLGKLVQYVKETRRGIPQKGTRFGVLKYLRLTEDNGQAFGSKETPLFRVNYLGNFDLGMTFSNFELDLDSDTGPDQSIDHPLSAGMEVNIFFLKGRLVTRIRRSDDIFPGEEAAAFIAKFEQTLDEIVAYCIQKNERVFTPSDFDSADLSQEDLFEIFGE